MRNNQSSNLPLVSVIIPNYNGLEYVQQLLPTLVNQDYPNFEVIFVDDHSPDRSAVDWVKKNYPQVKVIENKSDLGFAGANNIGFKAARGKYLFTLNNDVVLKNNYLREHVEKMESDPSIGILSCKILAGGNKGRIYSSGIRWKWGFAVHLTDNFQKERETDLMNLAAACIRRKVFDKVGFIEERYFMKFEDMDFSLQVREKTDYKLIVLADPLVTHLGINVSLASFANFYYRFRNLVLFQKRFAKLTLVYTLLIYIPFKFFRTLFSCCSCFIRNKRRNLVNNWKGLGGILKGTWDGVIGKTGPLS